MLEKRATKPRDKATAMNSTCERVTLGLSVALSLVVLTVMMSGRLLGNQFRSLTSNTEPRVATSRTSFLDYWLLWNMSLSEVWFHIVKSRSR